jgi:SAM-dependent methyltransferase
VSSVDLAGQTPGFDAAMAEAEPVEGWLTVAQARRLWERARASQHIVEIGSFQGRSTIVLALAAPEGATVTAIDPHAGSDRGPQEIEADPGRGEADVQAFRANLYAAGVGERVRHLRRFSHDVLGEVAGEIDLLYVDGAHRYGPARGDLERWGRRVRPGGWMLVHDAFSSLGVTLAIARLLVFGGGFRYLGRSGSLAEYRREQLHGTARLHNAGRQLAQLPWFVRNLAIKLAIVLRLRPLARLLGYRDGPWPY